MSNPEGPVQILMADDDPDDRLMAKKALKEYRLKNGSASSRTARS